MQIFKHFKTKKTFNCRSAVNLKSVKPVFLFFKKLKIIYGQ